MATWIDLFVFALTASAFVGAILGVKFVADLISSTVTATKESLKNRGLHISEKGVSVKTTSRYTHEDYVDATQRGFIKAMNAGSFSTAENIEGSSSKPQPITPSRSNSSSFNQNRNGTGTARKDSLGAGGIAQPPLARHDSGVSVNSTNSATSEKSSVEKKKRRFGLRKRNSGQE